MFEGQELPLTGKPSILVLAQAPGDTPLQSVGKEEIGGGVDDGGKEDGFVVGVGGGLLPENTLLPCPDMAFEIVSGLTVIAGPPVKVSCGLNEFAMLINSDGRGVNV